MADTQISDLVLGDPPVDADELVVVRAPNIAGGNRKITFQSLKQTINQAIEREKAISVEFPGASEDVSMFFTNKAITIDRMRAVLRGSATPSVTWTIRHALDRNAVGNEVVTGGTTTTSVTTGSDVSVFNDPTIPANSFVWVETTAQSGTVDEINITLNYTID